MTIRELYEEGQLIIEHVQNSLYNIRFINSEGDWDETQFTVNAASAEAAVDELTLLFDDFCTENGFSSNDVLEVVYVGQDIED